MVSLDVKSQLISYFDIDKDDEASIQQLTLLIYMNQKKVLARRFPPGYVYSEEEEEEALSMYDYIVMKATQYDYARIGNEGEGNHSENSVVIDYDTSTDLFKEIVPLVKVV